MGCTLLIEKITSNLEMKGYKVRTAPTLTGASGASYTPALLAESDSSAVVNFDNGQAQFSTIMLTHLMARDLNVAAFVYADEFSEDEKNWALAFNVHLLGRVATDPPSPLKPPREPDFPSAFELLLGFDTELRIMAKPNPEMWLVGCEAEKAGVEGLEPATGFLELPGKHGSTWLNWLADVDRGLALKKEAETLALQSNTPQAPVPSETRVETVADQDIDKLLFETAPSEVATAAPPTPPVPPTPVATPVGDQVPKTPEPHTRPHKPESAAMAAHRHGDLVMV